MDFIYSDANGYMIKLSANFEVILRLMLDPNNPVHHWNITKSVPFNPSTIDRYESGFHSYIHMQSRSDLLSVKEGGKPVINIRKQLFLDHIEKLYISRLTKDLY